MFERLAAAGLLDQAHYTALDLEPGNIALARQRLVNWGDVCGLRVEELESGLAFTGGGREMRLELEAVDAFEFARREAGRREWDLLVANAFLDLVDVPASLPQLFRLLGRSGLFYFTINFDGLTLLEPTLDPAFDRLVEQVYHLTMDERLISGRSSGDSRTGRRLFAQLRAVGAELLEVGSSDWVVFPGSDGYPDDEAYFLHFIIQTMFNALRDRAELDPERLADWAARRHAQVELRELVYIAHQLDFLGVRPEYVWGI